VTALERLQRLAGAVALAGCALGFLTSVGCRVVSGGDPGWASFLHPLLLVVGALAGAAAVGRGREIDRRRWQTVDDPQLTTGEREWAHKEAERQRRAAGTVFLVGPLALGYWLAYQIQPGERTLVASTLSLTPLLGFFAGVLAASLRRPPPDSPA
jgi:hypothetical protein